MDPAGALPQTAVIGSRLRSPCAFQTLTLEPPATLWVRHGVESLTDYMHSQAVQLYS